MEKLPNIHPGEVLLEEFLTPMGISQYKLAKDLKIPQTRVSEIVKRKRRITADTALRLSKYFGTSAKFWLGLQDDFDIEESANLLAKDLTEIPEMKKKRGLALHTSSMARIRSLCRACPQLAPTKAKPCLNFSQELVL
ncbi:MAG: HigA family addiction module antidote protein [Saprospirales bacterium]|nr:HigA family addiction module antidote protein [Saprospirales bacterium]